MSLTSSSLEVPGCSATRKNGDFMSMRNVLGLSTWSASLSMVSSDRDGPRARCSTWRWTSPGPTLRADGPDHD